MVKEKGDGKQTRKAVDAQTKGIKITDQLDPHNGPYYLSIKRNATQTNLKNLILK